MLPQEVKNRIYYFVCGGYMVHIFQNKDEYPFIYELSHAICTERISEEQVQKDFDSADPDSVRWNIPTIEYRHKICHKPPPEQKEGTKPNQLSLTLLRSCRQIYLEAKTVHYTSNTFAVSCSNVLERFVGARFRNKQHLAIRSLYLDFRIIHPGHINVWSDIITKGLLRRLKSVRCLYLNLTQLYCTCSVEVWSYEGSEMTECQGKMFKEFRKLPLKKATLVIDDSAFSKPMGAFDEPFFHNEMEQQHRWTMKQKQIFSKEVRHALLG